MRLPEAEITPYGGDHDLITVGLLGKPALLAFRRCLRRKTCGKFSNSNAHGKECNARIGMGDLEPGGIPPNPALLVTEFYK